jgi:hypothetical protein
LKPIISGVPAASTTVRQRSMRSLERSTGFSQNTALPARAPRSIRSAWVVVGVQIRMASTSPASTISSIGATRAPVAPASASAEGPCGVRDRDQCGARMGGGVAAVDHPDAACAQHGNPDHARLPDRFSALMPRTVLLVGWAFQNGKAPPILAEGAAACPGRTT